MDLWKTTSFPIESRIVPPPAFPPIPLTAANMIRSAFARCRAQEGSAAQQYDTWIKPLRAERHGNQLRVLAPNHHVHRWIRANLLAKIESRAERAEPGTALQVDLVWTKSSPRKRRSSFRAGAGRARTALARGASPEPSFTFTNFVNGKANQIAGRRHPGAENPPARHTTHSSSMAAPAWARPPCCRRSEPRSSNATRRRRSATSTRNSSSPTSSAPTTQELRLPQALLPVARPVPDRRRPFFVGSRARRKSSSTRSMRSSSAQAVVRHQRQLPEGADRDRGTAHLALRLGPHGAVEPPELEMRVAILLKRRKWMACT